MAAVAGRERGSASRATLLHDVGYHVVSVLDRLATKAAVRTQLAFGHSRVAFQHGLCCNRGRTLQLSSRGRARNEEVVGENAEGILVVILHTFLGLLYREQQGSIVGSISTLHPCHAQYAQI